MDKEPEKKPSDMPKKPDGSDFTLGDLVQATREMAVMLKQSNDRVIALEKKIERGAPPAEKKPEKKPSTPPKDIDLMPNSQLVEHLLSRINEEVITPLRNELSSEKTVREQGDIKKQLEAVKSTYSDFDKFLPEIQAVIKDNPSLNIEDAYHLAKTRAPDKVQALENERKQKEEEENKKKLETEKESFGGLLPTSGRTVKTESMDVDAAAESAWEDVTSALPAGISLN